MDQSQEFPNFLEVRAGQDPAAPCMAEQQSESGGLYELSPTDQLFLKILRIQY